MKASELFTPKNDIPDLAGKIILVTGGNSGLGRETILQLCMHNPKKIFLAARSEEKSQQAIKEIKALVSNPPILSFLQLDLSSMESIKLAAKAFREQSDQLHILINNAGIMATPEGLTKDGYEIQFGTNHLGVALFTQLLLPTLKSTATEPNTDVRVVFLSSSLEKNAPKTSYKVSDFKTSMPDISTWARYGISKLSNIHYSKSLALHHPDIKFICVAPGMVRTNLASSYMQRYNPVISAGARVVYNAMAASVEKGVLNQLWAAVSPRAASGVFYYPVGVIGKGSALSENEAARIQLWDWTENELEHHIQDVLR